MPLPILRQCRVSFTAQEFTSLVIEPALCALSQIPYSKAAAQLLLGTALHESGGLKHRRQVGGGPALSFFQMERATHDDIWTNFLAYNKTLAAQVQKLLSAPDANKLHELEYNDTYAAGMARVTYYRKGDRKTGSPIPASLQPQADYWKKHYNTAKGKGTPEKYKTDWSTHGGPGVTFRNACDV